MKINVYQGNDGDWYWRLVSRNGRTLADGSEGYSRKGSAERAAISFRDGVQASAVPVTVLESTESLDARRLPPMEKTRKSAATKNGNGKKAPAGKK